MNGWAIAGIVIVVIIFLGTNIKSIEDWIKKPKTKKQKLNNAIEDLRNCQTYFVNYSSFDNCRDIIKKRLLAIDSCISLIDKYLSNYLNQTSPLSIQIIQFREFEKYVLNKLLEGNSELILVNKKKTEEREDEILMSVNQ